MARTSTVRETSGRTTGAPQGRHKSPPRSTYSQPQRQAPLPRSGGRAQGRRAPEVARMGAARAQAEGVQRRADPLGRMMMYAFIALAVVMVCIQISTFAHMAQGARQISRLNTNIREMSGESGNLNVRLNIQQNIARVRDEAVYRLGMTQPEEGQIHVLSLDGAIARAQLQAAQRDASQLD